MADHHEGTSSFAAADLPPASPPRGALVSPGPMRPPVGAGERESMQRISSMPGNMALAADPYAHRMFRKDGVLSITGRPTPRTAESRYNRHAFSRMSAREVLGMNTHTSLDADHEATESVSGISTNLEYEANPDWAGRAHAHSEVAKDDGTVLKVLENLAVERKRLKAGQIPEVEKSQVSIMVLDGDKAVRAYRGLSEFLQQDFEPLVRRFFWVDVCGATKDDMAVLERIFGLHPLTTEDILTDYTREKAESYDNYLFVVVQAFSSTTGQDLQHAMNIDVAVFADFALTFHPTPSRCIDNVVRAMGQQDAFLRSDWVLYLVLNDVADELEPVVNAAEREVDAIDEVIFFLTENDESDVLKRISAGRKRLTKLTRRLKPKRDILLYMAGTGRSLPRHVHKQTFLYVRDILDLVMQMMAKMEASRDVINSTQSNYLAQVSVNLGVASNRGNMALNKLTTASAIFLPLNLIAGMWGMNIQVPWQETDSLGPWFGIMGFMVVLGFSLAFWARMMKFI